MTDDTTNTVFYGVEKTTDMKRPRVEVRRFRSEQSLKDWLDSPENGSYPFVPDAKLDEDGRPKEKVSSRNYNLHRKIRKGYEVPTGVVTKREAKRRRSNAHSGSVYYTPNLDYWRMDIIVDESVRKIELDDG